MKLWKLLAANVQVIGIVSLVSGIIAGFTIPYAVETISGFCEAEKSFPFWGGFIIGAIPGIGYTCTAISVFVAIITFILTFVL